MEPFPSDAVVDQAMGAVCCYQDGQKSGWLVFKALDYSHLAHLGLSSSIKADFVNARLF